MSFYSLDETARGRADGTLPAFRRTHSSDEHVMRTNQRRARRACRRPHVSSKDQPREASILPGHQEGFGVLLQEGMSRRNVAPRIPCRRSSQIEGNVPAIDTASLRSREHRAAAKKDTKRSTN